MRTPMAEAGVTVANPTSAKDLAIQAGFNQKVQLVDLYSSMGRVGKYRGICYGDKVVGIGSPNYKCLSAEQVLSVIDPLIIAGQLNPNNAGILRDGERMWISSKLDTPPIDVTGGGDIVNANVLSVFDNTGRRADIHLLTTIRIACENTLEAAIRGRDKMVNAVRILHRGIDPVGRAEEAGQLFCEAVHTFARWGDDAKFLASVRYSRGEKNDFLNHLYPTKPDAKRDSAGTIREEIARLAEHGDGQGANSSATGTWWGLVNGVTQYLDHQKSYRGIGNSDGQRRTSRQNNRFESTLLPSGGANKKKTKAFDLAYEFAERGNTSSY